MVNLLPVLAARMAVLNHNVWVVAFSPSCPARSYRSIRLSPKRTSWRNIDAKHVDTKDNPSSRLFSWFQRNEESPEGIRIPKFNSGSEPDDEELMHRTVKMMENHRRSQQAAERTATIMEELSNSVVTGKSKAGSGTMGLGGSGVKVTFDGTSKPISVEVDPKFLFSSSESGVISVEDLNAAITEAMLDGYEQSGKLMEEKMKALYEQLGLPKEGGK